MNEAPDALHSALSAITETLAQYARACIDAGTDGIFFATTEWATPDACTWQEYEAFGRAYDLPVLEPVRGAPFNILHVCRPRNMLEMLLDYPVAAVNWAVHDEGNPSFADIMKKTDKAVMGGLDQHGALLNGVVDVVRGQAGDARRETGDRRFLLAPGCSISPETPPENVHAAVEAARSS